MHETAPQRASAEAPRPRQGVAAKQVAAVAPATADDATALERQLDRERALRTDLEAQLSDQKAMYEVAMARNAAIWEMVDEQLREAALQVEQARQSQASATADVDRATRRAAELEEQIAGALDARRTLEQALAQATHAREEAATRHDAAMADATTRHGSAMAEADARIDGLESALRSANEDLGVRTAEIQRLTGHGEDLASKLAEAATARTTLERQLSATRTAVQDADVRVTRERLAASRKTAEREAELEGQLRQEREARATLERAVADAEAVASQRHEEHQRALAAAVAEMAALRSRLEGELSEATSDRDAAVEELGRQREAHAELERAAARSDAARREARQQLELALAAAANDLVECQAELERERGERHGRLAAAEHRVRELEADCDVLRQALEAAEAEAGQVPRLREQLEQAHRLESVGRLASEAAVTCGNLLADVHQNVQQWLTSSNGDATARQRGEAVLDDVTRAAGLLRQLDGYADEQERMPASADLGAIVRDLEPVLRRVAGHDVEIELPETIPSLDVEVGGERVERLLVNLASYGRERMPDGGRVKIELGATVVDREFVARHPNVRAGAHALITMTKSRLRSGDQEETGRQAGAWRRLKGRLARTPALDLGTLQGLVGECGGHLWMTLEPQGDMVAKLHLPLLSGAVEVA